MQNADRPATADWTWTLLPFVAGVALCEGVGLVAAWFTRSSVATWYPTLVKPWFTPPDWVFGPAWTLLYALMGIAAALVWRRGRDRRPVRRALGGFGLQLVLNAGWTIVFFGLQSIVGGLVVIALLWGAIAATMTAFFRLDRWAGGLLVPYLLWVTYAAALNGGILWLNGGAS